MFPPIFAKALISASLLDATIAVSLDDWPRPCVAMSGMKNESPATPSGALLENFQSP
jgi:hypothetical protein